MSVMLSSSVSGEQMDNQGSDTDPMNVTLRLLDWERFSQRVAKYAHTEVAQELYEEGVPVPKTREESEILQAEMEEAYRAEQLMKAELECHNFADLRMHVEVAKMGAILDGEDLIEVANSLVVATKLKKTLEELAQPAEPKDDETVEPIEPLWLLPSYFDGLPTQEVLAETIFASLHKTGTVLDSADPDLAETRKQIRINENAVQSEIKKLLKDKKDALTNEVETIRDGRTVLAVNVKQKFMVPGIVRDVSNSGGTVFIEPKQVEGMNTELMRLKGVEKKLVQEVLRRLTRSFAAPRVAPDILALCKYITIVDCAAARARVSAALDGQPVEFLDAASLGDSGLQLSKMTHPLLVWPDPDKPPDKGYMRPMDLRVPAGVKSVVITGPNTGGKTVILKTLGMAALMSKAGMRVLCDPDEGSEGGIVSIPFYESVMADIGDDQSIVQSLSTFSAHIGRIRRILDHAAAAPETSLVLLDEVGTGTDPTEGSALGMAVLRQLADDASLTLATTHHGRLKSLKYDEECGRLFENACVEFDINSMGPTYRVLWGIPGRSNALAIAERLGLQEDVVRKARGLLNEEGGDGSAEMDQVLMHLEKQKKRQRIMNRQQARINEELQEARDAAQQEQAKIARQAIKQAQREVQLVNQAKVQLEDELREARQTMTKLLKDARKSKAVNKTKVIDKVQKAAGQLDELAQKSRSKVASIDLTTAKLKRHQMPKTLSYNSIKPGQLVLVPHLSNEWVRVKSVENRNIWVVVGEFPMKCTLKDLKGHKGKVLR